MRRGWVWLLLGVLALVVGLTVLPGGRRFVRATLLVVDLLAPLPPPVTQVIGPAPAVTQSQVPAPGSGMAARYYQAAGDGAAAGRGALIFVIGYPSNIDDPQLDRLAADMARAGVSVLMPRLPGLRNGDLTRADIDALVAAFEWLSHQPGVDPQRVGFAGFCVGSSLALLAAEDPHINERVALVNAFGGYYDLLSLLRATAAHSAVYDGREYAWQPADQTVAVFAQNVLQLTGDPGERARLVAHFAGAPGASGGPPEGLSADGQLAYALLTTTGPAAVDGLLARLSPEQRATLAALSPSTAIEQLKAQLYIMHDTSDPYVPVTESYALAAARPDPSQTHYVHFELFKHVRPTAQAVDRVTLVQEGVRLAAHVARVLAACGVR